MKKIIPTLSLLFLSVTVFTQTPKPKAQNQNNSSVSEMQKQMEEAMKDMDTEEKAEFQKMMKGVMPEKVDPSELMFEYADFNSNAELVPKKDHVRIAAITKKKVTAADISSYASNLYAKIMAKGEPQEIALIKSVLPKAITASDLNNAAILAMEQGHPQAAMAFSMKAVQKDPTDVNLQNNMASLLSQYGYEEQAIPVLNKLLLELPNNSTVLNNLGQAWFGLGELDSAKTPIYRAFTINPFHAEALICGGLIDELQGDPKKAEQEYVKAMEKGPNPVISKILKNKAGDKGLDKIDFEKLKNSITIYEYFPKDWIKTTELSNNISGYEGDYRIHHGNDKMFSDLNDEFGKAYEAAALELEVLVNKGEEEFVKTMVKESSKGVNKMSRTAGIVIEILAKNIIEWNEQLLKDNTALENEIQAASDRIRKPGKNDKCADSDRKKNEYLAYINPIIRKHYAEKIEEYRVWLNAFCTWSWYMDGNPKNTILMACLGYSDLLVELYKSAAMDQRFASTSCKNIDADGATFIPKPEIPNFTCPTLVRLPIGKDWQQLSNTTKNFDTNSFGIKSNPGKAVPNHSVSFTSGKSSVAQSGIAPSVSIQAGSSSGHVSDGEVNAAIERGLSAALKKINSNKNMKDLTANALEENPLVPIPNFEEDLLTPLPDLRRSKLLRELLKKMMSADCNNVKSPEKLKEELEKMLKEKKELDASKKLKEQLEELEKIVEEKIKNDAIKEQLENMIKNGDDLASAEELKEFQKSLLDLEKASDALIEEHTQKEAFKESLAKMKESSDQLIEAHETLENIKQNGIQSTLNSSVQVPGNIQSQKGLFNN